MQKLPALSGGERSVKYRAEDILIVRLARRDAHGGDLQGLLHKCGFKLCSHAGTRSACQRLGLFGELRLLGCNVHYILRKVINIVAILKIKISQLFQPPPKHTAVLHIVCRDDNGIRKIGSHIDAIRLTI